MNKFFKKNFSDFLLYFFCFLFISTLFYFKFFLFFDYQLQDKLSIKEKVSDNIIIIAIDDESIEKYGEWPWNREKHADLIEKIAKNKAKVIAYDVTFSEKGLGDEKFLETIKKYDNLVFPFEGNLKIEKDKLAIFEKFLFPLSDIKDNALVGFTTLVPDSDAKVRKVPLFVYSKDGEEQYLPFFLLALDKANFLDINNLSNYNFKLDNKSLLLIKFFGPRESFRTFSYQDVMTEKFDSNIFKNKIVLVGATAKNLHDEYFTPTSKKEAISGVEIQANLMESFLQNKFLFRIDNFYFYSFLFICLIFLTRKIVLKNNLFFSLLILLFLLFFYILICVVFFLFGYLLSVFYPSVLIILVYFLTYLSKYLYEKNQREKIQSSFSQYVSKEVVNELIKNPEKLKLGGERKKMTILFSDIRGFTSFSEKMKPEDLVIYLNDYLTEMTDIIFNQKGVVDKFIGDAIMAFWGAPLKDDNQENQAVFTALEMFKNLKKFNDENKNKPKIKIGIGLNTGEVIVGNLGSKQRFDYTVIGDDVNLASRIESLTKFYDVEILISEKTKENLSDKFLLQYIDTVMVKGKNQAVRLFQVLDYKDKVSDLELKYLDKYNQAIELYLKKDWVKAEKILLVLKKNKTSKILDIYLDRIQEYKKNPTNSFDGIFRADFK